MVLIDGTPSDIELTDKIINLSNILLIPILPSLIDMSVTQKLVIRIQEIKESNQQLLSVRFILNQANNTNNTHEAIVRLSHYGFPILSHHIKDKVVYKRAYELGKGVLELNEPLMNDLYKELLTLIEKQRLLEMLKNF